VGAVCKTLIAVFYFSCLSIVRQKLDASGVPIGLPSYITVVNPWSRGP
jgi:hypothetical protein